MRGIALCASAVFFFALLDIVTKKLAADYNVPLILFVRYAGNLLFLLAFFAPRQGVNLIKTRRSGLATLRALCLVVSSLFVGIAIKRMPVAECTSIFFLAPLFVLLLAKPILNEKIGALGFLSAGLGFSGVFLVVRPAAGLDALGVVCAFIAAILVAAYHLLSRLLAAEKSESLLLYVVAIGSASYGILLPWCLKGPAPTPVELLLFSSIGLIAALGHFLFTVAYRYAPASTLAPINYLQLLWAGLLGWLIFDHAPDALGMTGIGIVVLSGFVAALKSGGGKASGG
ncbi:MAG: DMT family transporter, partial [Spirochaetia bacterium]|nr:DMT family transporter [Spirochaetia bacterium]